MDGSNRMDGSSRMVLPPELKSGLDNMLKKSWERFELEHKETPERNRESAWEEALMGVVSIMFPIE